MWISGAEWDWVQKIQRHLLNICLMYFIQFSLTEFFSFSCCLQFSHYGRLEEAMLTSLLEMNIYLSVDTGMQSSYL